MPDRRHCGGNRIFAYGKVSGLRAILPILFIRHMKKLTLISCSLLTTSILLAQENPSMDSTRSLNVVEILNMEK